MHSGEPHENCIRLHCESSCSNSATHRFLFEPTLSGLDDSSLLTSFSTQESMDEGFRDTDGNGAHEDLCQNSPPPLFLTYFHGQVPPGEWTLHTLSSTCFDLSETSPCQRKSDVIEDMSIRDPSAYFKRYILDTPETARESDQSQSHRAVPGLQHSATTREDKDSKCSRSRIGQSRMSRLCDDKSLRKEIRKSKETKFRIPGPERYARGADESTKRERRKMQNRRSGSVNRELERTKLLDMEKEAAELEKTHNDLNEEWKKVIAEKAKLQEFIRQSETSGRYGWME